MNATKVLLLPALLSSLPLLLGSNAPATRVAFTVTEGKSLTKVFEVKSDLSLEDMTMGGAAAGMAPDIEMTMGVAYKVEVTDDYLKVDGGAPKKLKRTYDALSSAVNTSMKMEMMGQSREQDSSVSAESALEGKSVVFTWDAEKKAFKRAFDPVGTEEKLLEGLREDMDFRSLLPDGEVSEGDEWEIDADALSDVLAPGGNMSLVPKDSDSEGMDMGPSGMENLADMFGEDVEGKSRATFTGMREVDGVQLAVIKLSVDMKAKTDITDRVREQMEKSGTPEGVDEMTFNSVDIEFAVQAEGELLWNVAAGHFHSLDLSGTTSFKSAQSMTMSVQGRSMPLEQSMEFAGTTSFSADAK